jgi:hypothetical protein
MLAVVMAVMSVFAPMTVDVPPELPIEVITWTANATETAERGTQVQVEPTAPEPEPTGINGLPFAPAGLSNCDEMTFYRVQAGLPARFDQIGWRESNCRNEDGVHTSCCWGYWQMHRMHMGGRFGERCGAWSVNDINSDTPIDKQRQACSAKLLYDMVGLSAWAATR